MTIARGTGTRTVDAIVQDIYGTLALDLDFEACVRRLGGAFAAHVVGMQTEDSCLHHGTLEIYGALDAAEMTHLAQDYSTRWAGKNLWVERGFSALLAKGYDDGDANVSRRELVESEYYRHFLVQLDIRYGMGISVRADAGPVFSIVTINRPASTGPFTAEEMKCVHALRPHLVNAYAIYRRVAAMRERAESLDASFDRVPLGMLVLDADGRLLQQNAAASRVLAEGRGLLVAGEGRLRVAHAEGHERLRRALARLCTGAGSPNPEAIVLRDHVDPARGAIVLHLCLLPPASGHLLRRGGRVLAFVCELDGHAEERFANGVLVNAVGLTPSEAQVVLRLRHHHDPLEVAAELGVAISTVRSHLKHAFRKTGTTRQSELLRLVDRMLAAAPH